MARTPQRDVNLAQKLLDMTETCVEASKYLLLPNLGYALEPEDPGTNERLDKIEDKCLNLISFIREYKRKVNPIELKGQKA